MVVGEEEPPVDEGPDPQGGQHHRQALGPEEAQPKPHRLRKEKVAPKEEQKPMPGGKAPHGRAFYPG
ncbi:hypothetical protein GCM10007092_07820 [Thermus composti]|nr:hypothetical protein GCM10007092_07820 [Thermus composti]